jgi:ubiquinone/menaquinone biosynthesis C-methylase UbiE
VSARLVEAGALPVGVDPVVEMLDKRPPGLEVAAGSAESLPFADATFDGAVMILVLGHIPDVEAPLREVARVLVEGGWLLLADMHPAGRERGWRRTFRDADDRVRELEWHAHPIQAIRAAAVGAGLRVMAQTEEPLARAELPDRLLTEAGIPAAYALLMQKW